VVVNNYFWEVFLRGKRGKENGSKVSEQLNNQIKNHDKSLEQDKDY